MVAPRPRYSALASERGWSLYLVGGPVRDQISLYTHPDQSKFTSKDGVIAEIRAIVDSGHVALKFDPFPLPTAMPNASNRTTTRL